MARLSAAVTTEFENVPAAALDLLAGRGAWPRRQRRGHCPGPRAEKAHFVRCVACRAPYAADPNGRTSGAPCPQTCCPAS